MSGQIGIIGVDPGMAGALCLLIDGKLSAIFDMPILDLPGKKKLTYDKNGLPVEKVGKNHAVDPFGVKRVLNNWKDHVDGPITLVIEKMWSRPGQSSLSMDKLLFGAGLVEGIAIGIGFGVCKVAPSSWKASMGVTADKKTALALARKLAQGEDDSAKWYRMFSRARDDGRAEAYLLAKYGQETT